MPDLKEWLGRDEIYTYWGRKASKGEKNPELMFIDPRPWIKRKPSPFSLKFKSKKIQKLEITSMKLRKYFLMNLLEIK